MNSPAYRMQSSRIRTQLIAFIVVVVKFSLLSSGQNYRPMVTPDDAAKIDDDDEGALQNEEQCTPNM